MRRGGVLQRARGIWVRAVPRWQIHGPDFDHCLRCVYAGNVLNGAGPDGCVPVRPVRSRPVLYGTLCNRPVGMHPLRGRQGLLGGWGGCAACPAGTFAPAPSNSSGATACAPCAAGNFSPGSGATACLPCDAAATLCQTGEWAYCWPVFAVGRCVPCADSDKPPIASFVAGGDDGDCAWACDVGLFRAVVDCGGEECVPCTNAPASGATYVSAGEPADADACQWACEASYALDSG